jgi:hypothetical protein
MNPAPKDTGKPQKWKGTELWRMPMQTGYDAFAVIRFDEESGFIRIVEELPDGTQMGCYVNFERHPSSYLALERKLAKAVRALGFYADKGSWTVIREFEDCYSCTDDSDEEPMNPRDDDDPRVIGGKIAREAIAELESVK